MSEAAVEEEEEEPRKRQRTRAPSEEDDRDDDDKEDDEDEVSAPACPDLPARCFPVAASDAMHCRSTHAARRWHGEKPVDAKRQRQGGA